MGTYKPSRANYDGSTSYGDSATDKHIFSGTVCISGSLILDGTTNISGGGGPSTDTLDDVTTRGNTTANSITVGSFTSNGNSVVSGNLEITNTLTAKEFHTQVISSSIIYDSGSTKFGDSADDFHQFTGSIGVLDGTITASSFTGSLLGNVTGDVTGDLSGTLVEATSITGSIVSASFFYGDGSGITNVSAPETDTLDDVTSRGNTTTNSITVSSMTGSVLGNVTGDLTGTLVEATSITGSIVSASFFYGDGSGITNISATTNTGKALWIDSVNGDDGTATRGKLSSPYLTIGAALSDALSGDTVQVFPGTYPEDGLLVPAGVTIKGVGDWPTVRVGLTSSLSDIMTIGDDGYVDHLAFNVPSSSNVSALVYSGSAGKTAGAYNITFFGDGLSGLGNGLYKTGPGKLIGAEIRCEAGGVGSITVVDAGALALESIHVPNSAGDIVAASSVLSGARGQFVGHNAENPNVQDAVYISGSSSVAIVFNPNWFNVQNGLHIASEDITAQLVGGQIDASSFTVVVDSGITGSNSEVRLDGIFEPKFSFPASALNTDFTLSFLQAKTDTRPSAHRMFGAELQVGFPEKGTPSFFGEGPQYSDGIVILTTDATATPTTDGANFIDVTTTGTVDDGNTFTFQTQSAGSTILVATQRFDDAGDTLKHFGYDISQVASDLTGTYTFETWNGSEWEEHGVQAVSDAELHRYSNDVFLRSSSLEEVRFGLSENGTPWTKKTINGTEAYWSRIRIDTTGASLPTFNQIKVQPSYFSHNERGQSSTAGLAMWKDTLVGAGNIFGESGGVVNASLAVGSGGTPTGWDQSMPNARLNQNGDAIYLQFAIPNGSCTAFPLNFSLLYSLEGTQPVTSNVTGTVSAIPIQATGINVADPSGGKVPVPRSFANTETLIAKAGTAVTKNLLPEGATLPATLDGYIHSTTFGPYDISSYYEGDIVAVRFELVDDGTPNQDVSVWALTVEGVKFTEGKEL